MKLSDLMKTYVEDRLYTPKRMRFGAPQYKSLFIPQFYIFRNSYRRFALDLTMQYDSGSIYLSVHKNRIFRYSFEKYRYHRAPFIALAEDFLTDDWQLVECPIEAKYIAENPNETPPRF